MMRSQRRRQPRAARRACSARHRVIVKLPARGAQGLFRTANQAKLADFLARDFSAGPAGEPGRQAAAKNAFVLISQHRAELAAAFFVLGAPAGGRPRAARCDARVARAAAQLGGVRCCAPQM